MYDAERDAKMPQRLKTWAVEASKMTFDLHADLEKMTRDLCAMEGVEPKVLIHPLRFAISGTKVTPGLFELMVVIGKENCLSRIQAIIQ